MASEAGAPDGADASFQTLASRLAEDAYRLIESASEQARKIRQEAEAELRRATEEADALVARAQAEAAELVRVARQAADFEVTALRSDLRDYVEAVRTALGLACSSLGQLAETIQPDPASQALTDDPFWADRVEVHPVSAP